MQYIAITKDNLEHSGVKGMHWEHRKSTPLPVSSIKKAVDDSKASMKVVKKESGKKSEEFKKAKSNYKSKLAERNAKIAAKSSKMYDHQSTMSKLFFDDPYSRNAAATYMVDHNMSMTEANKKANKEAVAVTAATLAIYGAMRYADFKMNN